jgi:hypothetical protein
VSDRATFVAGAMTGAAIISIAWLVVSWKPKLVEPPARHSESYDQCLASGRSTLACDAAMRVLAVEREKARREYEQACLAESKDRDSPFNKIACNAEANAK